MRGREGKGAKSADLLVCFPSRAHLTLMPKAICSPSRPSSESNKRHHIKKSSMHASPLMWAKTKQMGCDISEPTSPKVTCSGQIKIKHKGRPCKTWQSVMEEIERMHNNKKQKRPSWAEALGFKKEVMQFLTCLKNMKFDFRCFGAFPVSDIISDDDDDDDEDDNEEYQENHDDVKDEASKAVFSKWLMVLDENQDSNEFYKDDKIWTCDDGSASAQPAVPPANALLLMRCRSAPAKSWLKVQENKDEEDCGKKERVRGRKLSLLMEEEKKEEEKMKKEEETLVLMNYDTDYYNISTDIAKETWVIGGIKDLLSRSRSWRR